VYTKGFGVMSIVTGLVVLLRFSWDASLWGLAMIGWGVFLIWLVRRLDRTAPRRGRAGARGPDGR
jgi:hypothetical protein